MFQKAYWFIILIAVILIAGCISFDDDDDKKGPQEVTFEIVAAWEGVTVDEIPVGSPEDFMELDFTNEEGILTFVFRKKK